MQLDKSVMLPSGDYFLNMGKDLHEVRYPDGCTWCGDGTFLDADDADDADDAVGVFETEDQLHKKGVPEGGRLLVDGTILLADGRFQYPISGAIATSRSEMLSSTNGEIHSLWRLPWALHNNTAIDPDKFFFKARFDFEPDMPEKLRLEQGMRHAGEAEARA